MFDIYSFKYWYLIFKLWKTLFKNVTHTQIIVYIDLNVSVIYRYLILYLCVNFDDLRRCIDDKIYGDKINRMHLYVDVKWYYQEFENFNV